MATRRTIIPLIDVGAISAKRLRHRSLANLSCMGPLHATGDAAAIGPSRVDAPWLVKVSGGIPGGIGNTGEE